jgi:hypothetical protein
MAVKEEGFKRKTKESVMHSDPGRDGEAVNHEEL